MAVALDVTVYNYKGNPYYIPYDTDSMEDTDYESLRGIINDTKDNIMAGEAARWKNYIQDKATSISSSLGLNDKEEKLAIEQLLDGTLFDGIGRATLDKRAEVKPMVDLSDIKAVVAHIDVAISQVQTVAEAVDIMQRYINSQLEQNPVSLAQDYVSKVVADFASHKGRRATMAGSPTEMSVINAIVGNYNNNIFKTTKSANEAFNSLNVAYKKMMLLINMLPSFKGGNYRFKNGNNVFSNPNGSESQLAQAIMGKFKEYLFELDKDAAEVAVTVGVEAAMRKGLAPKLKEAHVKAVATGKMHNFHGGSGNLVITGLVPDDEIMALLNDIDGANFRSTMMERGQLKGDTSVQLSIGESGVIARTAITTKEYKGLVRQAANGQFRLGGNITLQNRTSLLALLYREAGLSGGNIIDLIKLAAMNQGSKLNLDQDWNNLIENLTYRMYLNTLTGMLSSIDTAAYFAAGGQIFTIGELTQGIINSKSSMSLRQRSGGGNGLQRSTYVAYNEWKDTSQPSAFGAVLRSNQVRKSAAQTLYNAKISVELRLSQVLLNGTGMVY